jgi:hypothetical protein
MGTPNTQSRIHPIFPELILIFMLSSFPHYCPMLPGGPSYSISKGMVPSGMLVKVNFPMLTALAFESETNQRS